MLKGIFPLSWEMGLCFFFPFSCGLITFASPITSVSNIQGFMLIEPFQPALALQWFLAWSWALAGSGMIVPTLYLVIKLMKTSSRAHQHPILFINSLVLQSYVRMSVWKLSSPCDNLAPNQKHQFVKKKKKILQAIHICFTLEDMGAAIYKCLLNKSVIYPSVSGRLVHLIFAILLQNWYHETQRETRKMRPW